MNLAVVQLKGGVGKTPLSFSIAKDLDLKWQSNDNSLIPQIYDKAKILNKCIFEPNTVYDFGGFAAPGILNILEQCKGVIVPITPNHNTIMKAIETIQQIKPVTKQIIGVFTNFNNEKELKETIAIIKDEKLPINKYFLLKSSRIFENVINNKMSFNELYNSTPLAKKQYQSFIDLYKPLLNYLRNLQCQNLIIKKH